jgi:ketosteroid isomerase-like protein
MSNASIEIPDVRPIDTIRRYYNGCSSADVELMHSTLHTGVVHYFLAPNIGSKPVSGREHLARYWAKVARMIQARWVVDHALCSGDEAVIEWTMYWQPQDSLQDPGKRVATRGAEWFVFRDGLIAEIRSYYQQREHSSELEGFPYSRRGYSGPDRELSDLHPDNP